MLKTQVYSPDSCGCTVEEIWDTDNVQEPHILSKIVDRCGEHSILDDFKMYDIMIKENQKKNMLLGHLLSENVLPLSMLNVQNTFNAKTQTKSVSYSLSDDIIYNYYFTGNDIMNRQIVFSLEGLDKSGNVVKFDNNQKSSIYNILSDKFGNSNSFQQVDHLHEDLHPEFKASLNNRRKSK